MKIHTSMFKMFKRKSKLEPVVKIETPPHLSSRLIRLGIENIPTTKLLTKTFTDSCKYPDKNVFEAAKVKVCFLFMSRSGSTFLMEKLNKTGLVGDVREHMNAYMINRGKKNWLVSSTKEYIQKTVGTSTSENGVFAFKGNLDALIPLAQIAELPDNISEWKFILIYRRDIVAQAISLARAKATGVWHSKVSDDTIDFPEEAMEIRELRRNYNLILRKQGAIERFIVMHNIEPLRLFYEDFCDDQTEALRSIFEFLSISPPKNLNEIGKEGSFQVMRNPKTEQVKEKFVEQFV